ncbi:hypothetical protein D0C36_14355 [Mucilaginibacter conchicola]|uniref:Uncharacterized protein n=1 Tax=Mucilaginibacter conchicola TaxID=2303333 RepID=A0A372NTL0_9SPHI|nr:hypothetical protein [Mucilaginibacter conchicola]RFZ92595.1 hypothetical protein D0C36_14355 [Mucilaginibacter conchicola]
MLTKIADQISDDKQTTGDEVTVPQLIGLSKNYFDKAWIKEEAILRQQNSSGRWSDIGKNDTRTITFSQTRIEELFKANPGSTELVIHLGIHDAKIYPGQRPAEYEGKVMVVLATKIIEKLEKGDVVTIAGVGDKNGGIDNGRLCPPDPKC